MSNFLRKTPKNQVDNNGQHLNRAERIMLLARQVENTSAPNDSVASVFKSTDPVEPSKISHTAEYSDHSTENKIIEKEHQLTDAQILSEYCDNVLEKLNRCSNSGNCSTANEILITDTLENPFHLVLEESQKKSKEDVLLTAQDSAQDNQGSSLVRDDAGDPDYTTPENPGTSDAESILAESDDDDDDDEQNLSQNYCQRKLERQGTAEDSAEDNQEASLVSDVDPDYAPPENPASSSESVLAGSDDGEYDPGELHVTAENENDGVTESAEAPRSRKRRPEKQEWRRNKIKKLRLIGEEYKGYERKDGKITEGILRPARRMAEACKSVSCDKSTKHFCKQFSEGTRLSIFNKFWNNLESWEEKKAYVVGNVEYVAKKRQSTQGPSRRKGTYLYYLRTKENERKRVFKTMFLGTLALKEDMVHDWLAKTEHGLKAKSAQETKLSNTRSDSGSKMEKRNYLRQWFESLPKLSSHYCRSDTNKLYLEQLFVKKVDLYRAYQDYCKAEAKTDYIVSNPIFDAMFEEMNLSLYKPKKDRCDICCAYDVNNITEADYALHVERKNRARAEKQEDQEKAVRGENYTLVVDVQAVKICPVVNASAIYYKMKLNTHNFTVYNLSSHQSSNYWWNETEGNLSASTFATFIIHYIEERCKDPQLPIVIYSDGCCYQNRNVILANALFQYSLSNNVRIEQKFLEKGHTQMECDAVHSLIERKLKGRFINLPSDYMNITLQARTKPFPLDALYVTHEFFKDYSRPETWSYKSIRPGKMTNDPTVTDLRHLQYNPIERRILYKINFDDELKVLPERNVRYPVVEDYAPLHNTRLRIKADKWKHLQALKHVLPGDCKDFYDNLPHDGGN